MHLPNVRDNVFAKCWGLCISLMVRLTLFHLAYAARRVPTNPSQHGVSPQIYPGRTAYSRKFIRDARRIPANSSGAHGVFPQIHPGYTACSGKFIRHTRHAASLQIHPVRNIPANSYAACRVRTAMRKLIYGCFSTELGNNLLNLHRISFFLRRGRR